MKKLLFFIVLIFNISLTNSQVVVFFDSFDQGLSNWICTGTFGLSTTAFSQPYSLTESPNGNYTDQTSMSCTLDTSFSLTNCLDATLEITAKYHIEFGFDFMYLDVSPDNGNSWINITSFTGDSASWWKYIFPLQGFVGNTNVKVRFRFESDDLLNFDGMYIDNLLVLTFNSDNTPPLIVHTPLPFYEGSLHEHYVFAQVLDISGVSNVKCHYSVDNVAQTPINGINTSGNEYMFAIPEQPAGSYIDYYFSANDNSPALNLSQTAVYSCIAGNMIKYDDGEVDYITSFGSGSLSYLSGAAVKFTFNGTTDLVTGLIRNYTDQNSTNSPMLFHVWSNNNGFPGSDMITPFTVIPAPTLAEPSKFTRVDLRNYASSLSNLPSGDYFIGFTVPSGQVWITISDPPTVMRSYGYFSGWSMMYDDYFFRVITSEIDGSADAEFSYSTLNDPSIGFTDLSTNSPTSWFWDFDENGTNSNAQNPTHVFSSNGIFNVCLTATNSIGSTTRCHQVTVAGVQPPIADFVFDTTNIPEILFTDSSLNFPTSWHWDFDDNGATSNTNNTTHLFSQNGTFNVCLIVWNSEGSDTICQQIVVSNYIAPTASYSYDATQEPIISFFDETTNDIINSANSWFWDFNDNGMTSNVQNPVHTFTANGTYYVCLTASNSSGSSTFCNYVVIDNYELPLAEFGYIPNLNVVDFTDLSASIITQAPTSWLWNFDDSSTSTLQNPSHNYAQNGTYNVCLIVQNSVGTDTICHDVVINAYTVPVALFNYDATNSPTLSFTEFSSGLPDYWSWDFGDNTTTTVLNPVHTFPYNGTFNTCLTVSNYLGSDILCIPINITSYSLPTASFSFNIESDSVVHFTDLTTNSPIAWFWDFNDGTTSTEQNPTHIYSASNTYFVCHTATNMNGTSNPLCHYVDIYLDEIHNLNESKIGFSPNPFSQNSYCNLPKEFSENKIEFKVMNIAGELLNVHWSLKGNQIEISSEGLSKGAYFYRILSKEIVISNGILFVD